MKPCLNFYARMMMLMSLMITGFGCAQTYTPRRYYGTSYTTLPCVYTSQRAAPYRTPSPRYQATSTPVTRQTRLVEPRATSTPRQGTRQAERLPARARRPTEDIAAQVKRQTEEIQRQIARQTAEVARHVVPSISSPVKTTTRAVYPSRQASTSVDAALDCLKRLPSGVQHFSRVQLGECIVPHVLCTDKQALLIWPISPGDDVRNAVWHLVAFKNELQRSEPDATIGMLLLVANGQVQDMANWQAQGVRCLNASQLPAFAERFFAQSQEPSFATEEPSVPINANGEDSSWKTLAEMAMAGVDFATNYMEEAPWWVWAIGAVLIFVVVFAVCAKTSNNRPFQPRDEEPWVVDPSGR